ncbi:MAG: hypothetical protein AB8B81_13305 [Halioglobus sp.]
MAMRFTRVHFTTMLLGTILFLTACAERDDETQIAENIASIQAAVEEKDFSVIEKFLHSSFTANERMDKEEVGRLLKFYSLQHKKLSVTIVGSNTTLHANLLGRADSVVSVIATGSSGLLPADGSLRKVDVEWIKTSGDWLVLNTSWRH